MPDAYRRRLAGGSVSSDCGDSQTDCPSDTSSTSGSGGKPSHPAGQDTESARTDPDREEEDREESCDSDEDIPLAKVKEMKVWGQEFNIA